MFMGIRDAEMTKYAANAMLATKISFMNEIANLCERLGADVENVRRGIGSDPRIGFNFIFLDVVMVVPVSQKMLRDHRYGQGCRVRSDPDAGGRGSETMQKRRLIDRIVESYGNDLTDLTFGLWGLAFKPGTDDVREASSTVMIRELVERGAIIKAYDPVAMKTIMQEIDSDWIELGLLLCNNQYDAITDVDSLILATEWNLFRQPDFEIMERMMKNKSIFDGRNQYDPKRLREQGWEYVGIGR